jgi:hypothetical protein
MDDVRWKREDGRGKSEELNFTQIVRIYFNKNRKNPFALVGGFASDVVTICFSL